MTNRIPQSTAFMVVFKAYLASDHTTEATGKTIAITISKNGGAFGNPNAGALNATEISSGWYKVALDTTDTGTLGPLAIRGAVALIDDVGILTEVVSATSGGYTNLDAAVTTRMATYTQPTGFLAATFPSGTIANQTNITGGTITTVTTVTNQLTAAAIATGVWTDTTAGDFTTALSVGKSLMNGVALGTGLTVNDLTTKTGFALTSGERTNIATAIWTDTTAGDFTAANSVGKSVMNGVALGTGLTVNDITTKSGYSLASAQTFNNTGTWTGNIVGTLSTLTTYTGNTPQTGDAYARIGAPVGASISVDVAAVKTDTAAIKTKTDSLGFTVSGKIDANILYVNGTLVNGNGSAGTPWGP